jgi:heme-degrading monooxygenase HmoA
MSKRGIWRFEREKKGKIKFNNGGFFPLNTNEERKNIMAVKILIQRKVRSGKEEALTEIVRELRSKAMFAEGFISGETLQSIEDPSMHLVISTWKNIAAWNKWLKGSYRKEVKKKMKEVLVRPEKMTPYQYE